MWGEEKLIMLSQILRRLAVELRPFAMEIELIALWWRSRDWAREKVHGDSVRVSYQLTAVQDALYSFGIRDIYTAELLYGRNGCEVYAFDCTVNHPEQLGPNVTFKPWWYVHISACPDLFSNDCGNNNNQTSMCCASLSLYVNSLGSGTAELKLDGKLSNAMQHASQNSNFMSLPQIIKRLGHESSELTILKMDCEVSWHCIYFLAFFFCS